MQVFVKLLGHCLIASDGRDLPLSARRESSLFAYLALQPNVPINRETLVDALWPDAIALDSRRLRQAIWKLRRMLANIAPMLTIDTTTSAVLLRCDPQVIDAARFTDLVTIKGNSEESLRTAMDLYKGDLLAGWTDEWINRPRQEFQVRFIEAAKQLCSILLARGAIAEALVHARRAVNADPADEDATYTFMLAADACGEPAAALAQYDIHVRALKDLDSPSPSAHLESLAKGLQQRRRALSPRLSSVRTASAESLDSLPLIERTDEYARLLQLLEEGEDGTSGALVITGQAGIGKTRLITGAMTEARLRGFTIFRGECPDVPNPPLWQPVVEALHEPLTAAIVEGKSSILAILQAGSSSSRRRRTQQYESTLTPIHSSLFAEELLSLLRRHNRSPILLVLENIQRADEATIVWLDLLLRRLDDFPVCAILTMRTGERDNHAASVARLVDAGSNVIKLGSLSRGGVFKLIGAALKTADPPRSLCDAMWHHIGGNPLSLLRAITILQTRGLLEISPSGWQVDAKAPDAIAAFASSHITAMVQQQLRMLPEDSKNILNAAAIIGGDVLIDHLQRLTDLSRQRFLAELDTLFHQGLLISQGKGMLRFTHEEVRHAVLDELTPPRRHILHGQVAELLSTLGDSARPEYMFWHYDAASDFARAREAATAAGDRCFVLGEHPVAIKWYERALESLSRDSKPGTVRGQLDIHMKLEAALNHHGDRLKQLEVLNRVIQRAGAPDYHNQLCEAFIRRSLCLSRMHRRSEAIQAAERALVISRRWRDLQHQAQAYRALGLSFDASDDHATISHLTIAARLFRRLGASTEESITLSEMAMAFDRLGEQGNALRSLHRASALLPVTDPGRAGLKGRQGSLLLWQGRLSEALEVLREALSISEHVGHRVDQARTLRILHDAYYLAGRYRDALSTIVQAWRIATQAKDTRLILTILNSVLGAVYARLGLVTRARDAFDRMKRLLIEDPESWYHAMGESSLAEAYLESGRWNDARTWAQRALATANARGRRGGSFIFAWAQQTLGHALIELGSPNLAIEPLASARAHFRSVGELIRESHITALLGHAAADVGDRVGASSYLHDSVRLARRIDKGLDLRHIQYLHGTLWARLGSPGKATRAFRAAHARLLQIAAGIAPRGTGGDRMPSLRRHFLNLPVNKRIIDAATRGMRQIPQVAPPILTLSPAGSNGSGSRADRIAARRKAILRTLGSTAKQVTRRDLAVALGVTPRTITNDLAALRRAGHQ